MDLLFFVRTRRRSARSEFPSTVTTFTIVRKQYSLPGLSVPRPKLAASDSVGEAGRRQVERARVGKVKTHRAESSFAPREIHARKSDTGGINRVPSSLLFSVSISRSSIDFVRSFLPPRWTSFTPSATSRRKSDNEPCARDTLIVFPRFRSVARTVTGVRWNETKDGEYPRGDFSLSFADASRETRR